MSVIVRPRGKRWQYDIRFQWPDGTLYRERKTSKLASKSATERWAKAREAELLARGKNPPAPAPKTPTLAEFWPRVLKDHYLANRRKASTVDSAQTAYRRHLAPALGDKPLDQITSADVAALKGTLADRAAKTANNILTVLSVILGCAVRWKILPAMPCEIGLLPTAPRAIQWYEVHEYRRMVEAAEKTSAAHLCLVLLAGSAGLRRGEIRALKWTDIDFERRLISVERAFWRNVLGRPKGGRGRKVPATEELVRALRRHRHLKEWIFVTGPEEGRGRKLPPGSPISNRTIRNWLGTVLRRANLPVTETAEARNKRDIGAIHRLRHTFCSHLAMAGVPAKVIQELAGHQDLKTTLRYMHLAPSDRDAAVDALAAYYSSKKKERRAAQ